MFTRGPVCGVYGVGTVGSARHLGVGTAMMAYLGGLARGRNASVMMLQTEAGSTVQKWYSGMGFDVVFRAAYYQAPSAR